MGGDNGASHQVWREDRRSQEDTFKSTQGIEGRLTQGEREVQYILRKLQSNWVGSKFACLYYSDLSVQYITHCN